jgi:chitin disaccharide deacetylase
VKELIVNADDFGRSPGVNAGVIRCHENGIVTSTTMMVRWPDAEEAASYAKRSATLGVGLHVDLGEWFYADGEWHARYEVPEDEVGDEVLRQAERFEQLVGRPPDHLDSHQHVHRDEPARGAVLALAGRLGVPVRGETIAYSGVFFGQDGRGHPVPEAITVEALVAAIEALPDGVTEFGCHPATAHDHDTVYGAERLREVETLCDPRVQAAIERSGVVLRTY